MGLACCGDGFTNIITTGFSYYCIEKIYIYVHVGEMNESYMGIAILLLK
jgi:hypothetical protein